MSGLWYLVLAALAGGAVLAAAAARMARSEAATMAASRDEMATIGTSARRLGEEVVALRRRLATTGPRRHDG